MKVCLYSFFRASLSSRRSPRFVPKDVYNFAIYMYEVIYEVVVSGQSLAAEANKEEGQ